MATDPYAAFAVQVSGPSPVQQQPRAPRQAPAQYLGPMPAAARDVFPSLIHQESRGRAGVSGPQTRYGVAQGRTQVLPDTARGVARNLGIPYRPELMTGTSPEAAAYQDQIGLGYLEEAFSNTSNAREALMYYHGGPNRALWGPKTNAYADEVLEKWSRGVGVDPVATAPTASLVSANAGADPYAEFAAPVEEAADDSGAPIEVEIDAGVRNIDGRAIVIHRDGTREDHGPWDRYWADQERSRQARLARLEREEDPEYQRAMVDARAGAEAVPDRLRALGLGGTLGFLTDINAEAQRGFQAAENIGRRIRGEEIQYSSGMAAQAARDAMRDAQAGYAAERPLENFALQAAGGFLAPGLGASANYVNAGRAAGGATLQSGRMARAAQVGAGYGLAGGIGNAEGNIIERLPEGAQGAAIGAGAGAILQGGADRFLTPRARPAESGGAARRLSRGGVDLMPGQMAAEVPVVGPVIRNFEDVLAGYNPLVPGVRKRQNEDVIRIAGNEALGEVGESLARTDRTGYQVSQRVSRVLGDRYDRVVDRTVLRADDAFDEAIDRVRATAAQTLNDDHLRRLNNVLDQDVLSQVRPDDTIPGEAFKRIETTLRQQADKASRPNSSLQDDDYVDVLNATRDVFRDIIARQNPDAAAEIAALNRGWAINARIRRAVSGGAQMARDGTPTPGELTNTVVQMSSEGQRAGERALLQGLASDARAVLPATVGDTGSGQRAVMGGVIGGVATGAIGMVNPTIATAIATGALVYSRPGIAALNAVYRATDGLSAQPALRQLAELARRDPALVPYYEAALQHVLGRESQGTAAAPQAVSAQQQASPALARVLQQ